MACPRPFRLRSPLVILCLTGAAACSAAGTGESPPFETAGEPTAPPAGAAGSSLGPSRGAPLPGGVEDPGPIARSEPDACVTARSEVEIARQPVDIIIALGNSGSMDDEARAVEENINVNFAAILQESQVDYRVILVSEHRDDDDQDALVCIQGPLSTLASCPSEQPGQAERFFHYSTEVGSSDSFEVLIESYDGSLEDDFGLAPVGWSEWLRPGAKKVFLEITDDDDDTPAAEFVGALTGLAPEQFGADPSQLSFVWHSIVGVAQRPIATEPYAPSDPIEAEECTGDVSNAGTTYQELSRLTGGLRFPICELGGYDAVFQRIADDVIQNGGSVCDFDIPAAPEGQALDLEKVAVSYQPSSGAPLQVLGRVETASACRAGAFVVDATGVHLCPEVCDVIGADPRAAVDVLFTCENTLLR